MQPGPVRRNATRADRASDCRSRAEYRIRQQLLPGAPLRWTGAATGSSTATTGTKNGAKAQGRRSEPGLELGHHLSAHHRSWDLAVPLPGKRRQEPKGSDLGCG
jgi:hypothetical protein